MERLSKAASYPYSPMHQHYGFAVFHKDDNISRCILIAQKIKNNQHNCIITWFASEESNAVIRNNPYIDQIVVLEGSAKSLEAEIPRLQTERSWSDFFTCGLSKVVTGLPQSESHSSKRILLGQLVSNGDCLYATTLARQIKHDYPGCHLTWAVSSLCRSMVEGNPFVDEIWEIPLGNRNEWASGWYQFEQQAQERAKRGEFDEVFLTQIYPKYENFDGTIRPSIFRAYPKPVTVPIQNILRLRDDEVEKVRNFAEQHNLLKRSQVILFECAPQSSQSFVTPDYALYVAQELISRLPDCSIILSSNVKIPAEDVRIIDGSVLSLRENAELSKYCTLFIGCSSGITQTVLTDWAKPLPTIQLLLASTSMFASVAHDLEYWGYSSEQFLEMMDSPSEQLLECVHTILMQGFSEARRRFHQQISIDFNFYLLYIRAALLQREQYVKTARAISYAVERYGWHQQLKTFVQTELIPQAGGQTTMPLTDEDCTKFLQKFISISNMLGSNILPDSEQFLATLFRQIDQYQQNKTDKSVLDKLRETRKQIAELWLGLPTEQLAINYAGALGKAHQIILNSGFKYETLTTIENTFVDLIAADLARDFDEPKAIQYLLAAMLYRNAYQLPLQNDLTKIPRWVLKDYLKFVLSAPRYFYEVGEAYNYYHYVQRWVNYLHSNIVGTRNSSFWKDVALVFLENASFLQVYFNEANLKDLYVKRAEIIEYFLRSNGHEIDCEFSVGSPNRKKLRLGILASHFIPSAETFASLPIYEYISRDFEVILYSLSMAGHPLEQYCQSCANSFRLLPNNLTDRVNFIRGDDLDILFIATNVTVGTNPICLLGLHRLARVQVTSVASVVTTGIRNVDYYISGKLTDPSEDAEQHYQEKLLKIEGTAHCFSYGSEKDTAQIEVTRENLGISREAVVFISGANLFKILPELFHTWAKIIAAVPNSVLVLYPWGPNWSDNYPKQSFTRNLHETLVQQGVESERLIILDPDPVPNRDDIKEYLKLADIYLDSHPFSGTTSIIDPLEVGLPVVARQGTCFRSAMGAALLQELAMPDLVANSEESYIQLAIALGTNPELHQQKSEQIQQKMRNKPRFMDSRSYSSQIGTLFQEIFQKYLADTLINELRLKDINLIIFPDWSQPEESFLQSLASAIREIVTHPDKSQITLLVDTRNIADEEADLAVSSVVMNLLMEEDLDVSEGAEISLVGKLSERQWEALLTRIHSRIVLENENKQAIADSGANNIPICEINHLSSKRVVQLTNGSWGLQELLSD